MRGFAVAASLLLAVAGCGDESSEPTTQVVDGLCAEAPVVTWETFGEGFITQNCQSCHSAGTTTRNGAPENVTFDSRAEVTSWSERILARSVAAPPTMPPGGGLTNEEQYRLEVWLRCWE